MRVQVAGKHVDVGEALRGRIADELTGGIGKYFERGGDAEVVVSRDGHSFRVDCTVVLATGQPLQSHGLAADAHAAFSQAMAKIETRIRRYKRRLKSHTPAASAKAAETGSLYVLRGDETADEDWDNSAAGQPPSAMVIAETEAPLKTMTVSMAVMDLDLTESQAIVFRNAAHGGLSVVYRRPDGNIGWVVSATDQTLGLTGRWRGAMEPNGLVQRIEHHLAFLNLWGFTHLSDDYATSMIGDLLGSGAITPRLTATTKRQVISTISEIAARTFHLKAARVFDALMEREALGPTGVGHGVAIPHARIEGLDRMRGVFVRVSPPIDFGAVDDKPVDLVFALLSPASSGSEHLRALARIARALRSTEVRSQLRQASGIDAIRAVLVRDARPSAA